LPGRVRHKASVEKDLRRLDRQAAERVVQRIEAKLTAVPPPGTPLSGEFRGLFRLSVGDYRVIFSKEEGGVVVLRISHRKEAYR
jgi:mRNA-degrading endonuclease RelE of RelBE toxin-antitoxin system